MTYITFREARATQLEQLDALADGLAGSLTCKAETGAFEGPGPVFVGIGASLAAAAAPVWHLRSRGVEAYRLGAGEHPIPLPPTDRPVVGVSQSGRSPETLAALTSAPPGRRFAVVNATPSPLASAADLVVSLGGLRDSYASTLGFTATVMALGMMAELWDRGRVDPGWARVADAAAVVERTVLERRHALTEAFAGAAWADVVGGGPSTGSAEVGALLLREVVRVPATAMSTRQYLHGAMESAGGGVHLLFGGAREAEVASMLTRAGHRAVLVTDRVVRVPDAVTVVPLPDAPPSQRALLEAVLMQTLVEGLAASRGVAIEEFVFHHTDTKLPGEHVAGTP